MNTSWLVYDQNCYLCKNLALLCQKNSNGQISAVSYDNYKSISTLRGLVLERDKPHFTVGEEVFSGDEAFSKLLEKHPKLSNFSWIMRRLGVQSPAIKVARFGAGFLKRRCSRC